ncbi:MAG: ABC transporter ATP-binding protein [Thermoproteota archaeon]
MPKVVLENVSKRFDRITALDGINLVLEDGDYSCILGPTGSGKTTLLKTIAGLVEPDTGDVYIDGKRVTGTPPEKRNAAYMHQNYALFPHLTVSKNIIFGLTARGFGEEAAKRRVSEVLEIVKLGEWADAYPRELSGGMQQRVALARCLATGARLLLLDEPLGALDARLRLEVRRELSRIAEELNLTVIHVTHDQSEALSLADRLILMRNGKIVQTGSPLEVYFKPSSVFSAYFVGESVFLEGVVAKVEGQLVYLELRNGTVIEALSNDSFNRGELAVAAVRCEDIAIGEGSLTGLLKEVNFLGSFSKLVFELQRGLKIPVNIPLSRFIEGGFRIGASFQLSIPREKVYLFKYPPTGLAREIEAV